MNRANDRHKSLILPELNSAPSHSFTIISAVSSTSILQARLTVTVNVTDEHEPVSPGGEPVLHGESMFSATRQKETPQAHRELNNIQHPEQEEDNSDLEVQGAGVGKEQEQDIDNLGGLVQHGAGLLVRAIDAAGSNAHTTTSSLRKVEDCMSPVV